jgi:hypothetical protein
LLLFLYFLLLPTDFEALADARLLRFGEALAEAVGLLRLIFFLFVT